MTSLQTQPKQSQGYFITMTTGCVGYYISTPGSGSGGAYVQPVMTPLAAGAVVTALAVQGTVLRDLGKTVTVGGIGAAAAAATTAGTAGVPTRVFRKVQLINAPTRVVGDASNVANGVGGSSADANTSGAYQTLYIELPTLGRSGGSTNILGGLFTYVNGLPGLYA